MAFCRAQAIGGLDRKQVVIRQADATQFIMDTTKNLKDFFHFKKLKI